MSEEDLRINKLRFGQQNADLPETDKPAEKDNAVPSVFNDTDQIADALSDISKRLRSSEETKARYRAVQQGFAGITSYGDLDRSFNFKVAVSPVEGYEYRKKLDAITFNSHNLSKEDMDKILKEVSGMTLEEYKEHSKNPRLGFNGEFRETPRREGLLDYYSQQLDYGKETMDAFFEQAAGKKEQDYEKTKDAFKNVLDNEGFVSWCMNGLIFACGGTTRGDVQNALNIDAEQISQLKQYLKDNDVAGFMAHYRAITGVKFDIANFIKLAKSERKYQVFSFAKRFDDARKTLAREEAPTYVNAMGAGIGTGRYYEQTNYNLDSYNPKGIIAASNYKASPLEVALVKVYGDTDTAYSWIQANIKRLGLEDKSPKEKYKALVNEFYSYSDSLNKGLKEQFGNTNYEEIEKDYKQDLKNAYGRSMSQEALDNYVSNQAMAKGALNMAILIGAGMFAGPAALTAIVGTLSTLEKATDANGLTGGELVKVGGQMVLMYAGFKVFEFAAHAASSPIENYLLKQGISKKAAGFIAREASSALGGMSAGMTTGTVAGLVEGKDLIDAAKQGFTSAIEGAAFALTFGAIFKAISSMKAARIKKAEIKTAESKLIEALSKEKDPTLKGFAELIKQEGLSKELLSKIHRQAAKIHHPDLGGNADAMGAYNNLIKNMQDLIKDIKYTPSAKTAASEGKAKQETVPVANSKTQSDSTSMAVVPKQTAENLPLLQYSPVDATPEITAPLAPQISEPLNNGNRIKNALARTINAGTQFATTITPFLSVYGAQLPAIPSAVASLLAGTSAGNTLSAPLALGAMSPKKTPVTDSSEPSASQEQSAPVEPESKSENADLVNSPQVSSKMQTKIDSLKKASAAAKNSSQILANVQSQISKSPSSIKAVAQQISQQFRLAKNTPTLSTDADLEEMKKQLSEILAKHAPKKAEPSLSVIKDLDHMLSDYMVNKPSDFTETSDYFWWGMPNEAETLKLHLLYAKAVDEAYPDANIELLMQQLHENKETAKILTSFIEAHPDMPAWAIRNIIEENAGTSATKRVEFNLQLAEKYIFQAKPAIYRPDNWGRDEIAANGLPQLNGDNGLNPEDYAIFEKIDDIDTALIFSRKIVGQHQDLYKLPQQQMKRIVDIIKEKELSSRQIDSLICLVKENPTNTDTLLDLYESYSNKPTEQDYKINWAILKASRSTELVAAELDIRKALEQGNSNSLNEKLVNYQAMVRQADWRLSLYEDTIDMLVQEGFLDIQHGKNGSFLIPSGLLYEISQLTPENRQLFKTIIPNSDFDIFDALNRVSCAQDRGNCGLTLNGKPVKHAAFQEEMYRTLLFVEGRNQQFPIDELFGYNNRLGDIGGDIWDIIKKRGLLTMEEFESQGISTSVEDLIDLAKLSDEDFEKLRAFAYIKGRKKQFFFGKRTTGRFSIKEIKPDGEFFKQLNKKQIQIARKYAYVPELGEYQLGEEAICAIAKIPAKAREEIEKHIFPLIKTGNIDESVLAKLAELTPDEISAASKLLEKNDFILWDKVPDKQTAKNAIKLLELKEKYPDMVIFKPATLQAITIHHDGCQRAVELFEKINPEENPIFKKYPHVFIRSKTDIDTIIKLSTLKREDGTLMLEDAIIYNIEDLLCEQKQPEKLLEIIDSCETVPELYIAQEVLGNKVKLEYFLKTKDIIMQDGKPVGGDLALIFAFKMGTVKEVKNITGVEADTPELGIDHPYITKLIDAKMKNGNPLFTRRNIADIISGSSGMENTFGIDVADFMIEQLRNTENRNMINFASKNSDLVYAYGIDVISHMSKYNYMSDGKALREFLNKHAQIIGQKNQALFLPMFSMQKPDPEKIKQAMEMFKSLLDESLNYNLFDKINALPVSNNLKLKLATNNLSITERGLDIAISYLKSLDKTKLAQCSDENVSEIITIKATEISSKNISDNLGILGKISKMQEKFNETEKELFGAELEKISAKVAKALNQVITPAQVKSSDMTRFFRSFGLNADPVGDTTPDSILSSEAFGEFLHTNGKNGIPLAFSRKEFIRELNNILRNLDEATGAEITEKLGIEFSSRIARVEEFPDIKKPASTFAETPYPQEEYENFEKEHLAGKATSPVELIFEGKPVEFIKYEGTQGGSNEGYIAKTKDGELFYIKFPSSKEAASQEVLASRLYREAGILAPEISFVKTNDGKSGIASKIIPNTHPISTNGEMSMYQLGFAADAWLANWDILRNDNAVFSVSDDTCARMDVGGSLEYRARGDRKNESDFDYKVKALSSLISNNPDSPLVQISVPVMKLSMERVLSIQDETIYALVKDCGCPKYLGETLIARKNYIANIYNQLKDLPPSEIVKPEMLEEMDKNISYDNGNAFNGILTDSKLNPDNPIEKQVQDLVHEFMYENELQIENPEIKELMTQLVKAFPEYMSIIGKQQHGTHIYSVDGHILTVLNKAMNAPEYENLSKMDKLVLKLAILFHDISKAENLIDHSHPKISSMYARDILKRVKLPTSVKERIVELIENHHWFKRANSNPSETDMKELAARFRRNGDLTLAKIFADADLSSIRPGFEIGLIENLPAVFDKLQKLQKEMHSIGSFTYTTPVIRSILGDKANTTYQRNGHTFNISVLNFSQKTKGKSNTGTIITDETDLRDFGFVSRAGHPVSKQDLSFLAHCTENPMDIFYLGDICSNADICTSNITLSDIRFYDGRNASGVILEPVEQANVGSSLDKNQGSGYHKNFVNFSSEIWAYSRKDGHLSEKKETAAIFRRSAFTDFLQTRGITLTEEEYAEIHQTFFNQMFLSHIHDIRLSNGRIIKEKDLKDAIKYTDEQIRAKKDTHNETNVYAPKVKALFSTEDSLDKVPLKILQAAEELDVPIFLLGRQ